MLGKGAPSPLGVGSGEGAVPPPRKFFWTFLILKWRYLVHSEMFFKLYIPIFACQFCDREGDSLWLDDE